MATLQPERIGDVEEGEPPIPSETDELGLTAEERQAFDGMKDADSGLPEGTDEGEPPPAADTPAGVDRAPGEAPPAAKTAKKQAPAEPEEDDEPDLVSRDPRTGKEQRTISFGKHQRLLQREREQAEALRNEAQEFRVNQAKLAERLAILNEALTAPPPPEQQTPEQQEYARQQAMAENPMLEDTIDPSIDLPAAITQMQRRQLYMANASMQQQETTQETLADQAMLRDFTRDTQLFSSTVEGQHFFGMEGAYQFLKNSRLVELGISLFDKDPTDPQEQFTQQEINKMISDFNQEEKWVVNNALSTGKSPAKAIMKLAKGRGWKPPQPQAAAAAPPTPAAVPRRTSAQTSARTSAQTSVPSAVAQLQAEADGAANSRSLSDGGGAPPSEPLGIDQLLKMGDEEFGQYIDNLPKQRLEAMMGREFPGQR